MRKSIRNATLVMLVTALCLTFVGISTAEPTYDYDGINVDPVEPEQQSEVAFSVEVTGDEVIDEVYIRVQECRMVDGDEQCHKDVQNKSMTNTDGNNWTVTTDLIWDMATIGHCWLEIYSNDTWYNFAPNEGFATSDFTITTGDDGGNGGNGGDGNGDSDDSPGFELILVMISIIAVLFIFKRKRIR